MEVVSHGAAQTRFPCLGCGPRRPVRARRTYCKVCRERLRNGNPTDLDDYLTMEETEHLRALLPGEFYLGKGWKPPTG